MILEKIYRDIKLMKKENNMIVVVDILIIVLRGKTVICNERL